MLALGLNAEDVAALFAAGFDTPRKVKDADAEDLPDGIAEKMPRWFSQG